MIVQKSAAAAVAADTDIEVDAAAPARSEDHSIRRFDEEVLAREGVRSHSC